MRLARLLLIGPFVLLLGCPEQPTCVDFDQDGESAIHCSAGKVAVCGDDPEALYDDSSGELLPVDLRTEDGTCGDDVRGACRPRPVCNSAGESVCPDGASPRCVLGAVDMANVTAPPTPDSGPADEDAGPMDEDAGTADDAGSADDAGTAADAGADSGS